MAQSPETSGGAGFTYESGVSAVYLSALLTENTAVGLNSRTVKRVCLQQAASGEPLDDLIIDSEGPNAEVARLSLQIKSSLTLSAQNKDFQVIIISAYVTVKKKDFRNGRDRVGVAVRTISEKAKRDFETICEWARSNSTSEEFISRFKTTGNTNKQHRKILADIKAILGDQLTDDNSDTEIHNLLRHFLIIKFDLLQEGSDSHITAVSQLQNFLHPNDRIRAGDLWEVLQSIAHKADGRAATFDRVTLIEKLNDSFRFNCAPSMKLFLEALSEQSSLALKDISDEISGVKIQRTELMEEIKKIILHQRFVQLIGLPGSGKSAFLKEVATEYRDLGVMVIKSDRLPDSCVSWVTFASAIGVAGCNLTALLYEITAITRCPILFIDGLDRVGVRNRGVIRDIFNTILGSEFLKCHWRIITSFRNDSIDSITTWLPEELFRLDTVTINVGSFNDKEAEILAKHNPALRPFLFGDDRIREISRRPFFAGVIEKSLKLQSNKIDSPNAEITLLEIWWKTVGHGIDRSRVAGCQRALINLAKIGASSLGSRIRYPDRDVDIIEELKSAGIIKDERVGHTIKFSHDIYFEWSFTNLLIETGDTWMDEIRMAGEPPVLGRVVELLSQDVFLNNENWAENLTLLENASSRSQWVRAWLLGPIGITGFEDSSSVFTNLLLENGAHRLVKFAAWFQAEKTRPNPLVLNGSLPISQASSFEKICIADTVAWPSDFSLWGRCCVWLLNNIGHFPHSVIPDVLSIFEVWQNAFFNSKNKISKNILIAIKYWLEDIENRRLNPERFEFDYGPWKSINKLGDLEDRLRAQLLRAARVAPDEVHAYLIRAQEFDHLRRETFNQILMFSPVLAESHPSDLVNFTLRELLEDLPNEFEQKSSLRKTYQQPFSYYDWERLSIGHRHNIFYPPSPLREPFQSLFQHAPNEALRLVREICNHATNAWIQLASLDDMNRFTPLPIELDFPWGKQEFWGDGNIYCWFRGFGTNDVVQAALMSLEHWVFSEAKKGRNIDEIIREVVAGQKVCAVLGIAVSITLAYQHVSTVTLPIVTSQHLWHWDIQRSVQDSSLAINTLGFDGIEDQKHIEAVRLGNDRAIRRLNICSLAMLFVTGSDTALAKAASEKILNFPQVLPFSTKEESENQNIIKYYRDKAVTWSEWGKREHYTLTPTESNSGILIELKLPESTDPAVIESQQHTLATIETIRMIGWVTKCLEMKQVSEEIDLSRAVAWASSHDAPTLFSEYEGNNFEKAQLCSAVAGVAAVVLSCSDLKKHLDWAKDVIFRAASIVETNDELTRSGSRVPFHPCIYAIDGLAALIKNKIDIQKSKLTLLTLAAHFLDQISLRAINTAVGLWLIEHRFSWAALNLGLLLSKSTYRYDHAERKKIALEFAKKISQNEFTWNQVEYLPEPWIFAEPRKFERAKKEKNGKIWRDPDEFLCCDYLAKFLNYIPVDLMMSDSIYRPLCLNLCKALIRWTIERLNPSWMNVDERNLRDHQSRELIGWRPSLFGFLAKVANHMSGDEVLLHFLNPTFELPDELALSLIQPFVDLYVCCSILDSRFIEQHSISILESCTKRMLKHFDLNNARNRDGRIYSRDIGELIKALLFIRVSGAKGAVRFANDNWGDIASVLPIVDLIVRNIGDLPFVIDSFLTLCERSIDAYPPDVFVEQITTILSMKVGVPISWGGTLIPGRIATLIQMFAERTNPLKNTLAQKMLRILDILVDMGDRRAAALQVSEIFKEIRV